MECRDPGGWGDSTAAPVRTTGFGGAARVLSTHDAGTNDVNSSLGCTAPNRKSSHFPWVHGHLAHADAWERGPPARMMRCAVDPHRSAYQHTIGGRVPNPSLQCGDGRQ